MRVELSKVGKFADEQFLDIELLNAKKTLVLGENGSGKTTAACKLASIIHKQFIADEIVESYSGTHGGHSFIRHSNLIAPSDNYRFKLKNRIVRQGMLA